MRSTIGLRRVLVTALVVLLSPVVLVQPAHANAERCVDNWSGNLCLQTTNSGATVSRAKAILRFHSWYCGGPFGADRDDTEMYFTLWGTRSNGSSFAMSGSGACDVNGTYARPAEAEYKTFVVNTTFRSRSTLCLRADFQSSTSGDGNYACYIVP
ncbi:hypothetical protein [Micromonospora sp. DH14]|uniref:hypothetical protein n=1 Tax=Micromonospora sp. DH14 TaxID=3040120 RepID=UPI002441A366|nr:hypothetical protein [Micromonospora sp. DH14]MDG9675911.1 hypothetical protein [Micromonospora sp. DH14]